MGKPYVVNDEGNLVLRFHEGQWRAWDSERRFTFVTAGTQGGKTAFGPFWLHREVYHPIIGRGGGDYLAVTANFGLFKLRMLPALRELFEDVTGDGRYWAGDKIIELRDPSPWSRQNLRGGRFWAQRADDRMWGRIVLRSAEAGSGLESAAALGVWMDECGMDSFTGETWRAVRRRLSLARGRVLGTTTLYVLHNWLTVLYEEWVGGRDDVMFVQFPSVANPAFPRDEFDQVLREMPAHVVNMQYRGVYDKPPGLVYDVFESRMMVVTPFAVPAKWIGFGGMDYGGVNTACLCLRYDAEGDVVYVVDEYRAGGRTARQHVEMGLAGWNCQNWRGGARSEGQWRDEFRAAGLPVQAPEVADVWQGINWVYAAIAGGRLKIFDRCEGLLGQLGTYRRRVDSGGRVLDEIVDKEQYHFLDALRYVVPSVFGSSNLLAYYRRRAMKEDCDATR